MVRGPIELGLLPAARHPCWWVAASGSIKTLEGENTMKRNTAETFLDDLAPVD